MRLSQKFSSLLFITIILGSCLSAAQLRAEEAADASTDANAPADRPFPSDRPGKASSPISVEQGHFEVESDFVNFVYDHWSPSSTTTHTFLALDPAIKYGLTSNIDLELEVGGYQHFDFKDRSTGATSHAYGWGDNQIRAKINLAGNDGEDFAIGLIPYIKLPTASQALRNAGATNNSIEGGLAVPVSYNLPNDFIVSYQAEIDANKNADNGDFHPTFVNIPAITHPIPGIENLSGSLEFYSSVNPRKSADDPNIYTLDPSLAYQLTPKIAFDVETDIGLNRAAPDLETICGIAWVF